MIVIEVGEFAEVRSTRTGAKEVNMAVFISAKMSTVLLKQYFSFEEKAQLEFLIRIKA